MDRNEAIKRIKTGLKKRSGKTWSVTGGRGTAWGWITISAPPRRMTMHWRKKEGAVSDRPEDYELVDTGILGGYMRMEDIKDLTMLLCLKKDVHFQGELVPAGIDYYNEYTARAEGRTPDRYGQQYWD